MKQTLVELFGAYAHEMIFLHIISAIIWVGGMIAIRLAVHPSLQTIEEPSIKLGKTLLLMGKFFNIVMPFIIILIITAVFMSVGLGFRDSAVDGSGNIISQSAMDLYNIVHIKEVLWMIMSANFTFMYIRRRKAQKLFDSGDLASTKALLSIIPKYLLPLNIILGIWALYLGVTLRGF